MTMTDAQRELAERYTRLETDELTNLYRQGTLTDTALPILEAELRARGVDIDGLPKSDGSQYGVKELGFVWWTTWAWLGLTIGNIFIFVAPPNEMLLSAIFVVLNSALMMLILTFNKYAFLAATVLSFNPLLWIINGVYLKRRWGHPKVNKN